MKSPSAPGRAEAHSAARRIGALEAAMRTAALARVCGCASRNGKALNRQRQGPAFGHD